MASSYRVIIIDDNESIHADFRKVLCPKQKADDLDSLEAELFGAAIESDPTRSSFQLESAFQGQEGFEMVKRAKEMGEPFAMAFLDMRMPPGWDGLETLKHLWEVDPDLQVVICTAYTDHSWEEIIGTVDARDCLMILRKPFDAIEILQVAHTLTTKWNSERQVRERIQRETERADELERARERAENASRAKSDFLAMMSHEIRTPMNSIIGTADLLSECEMDEDGIRYVKMLRQSGENLLTIINDILDLAKIESGRLELETTEFSISELMHSTGDMHSITAKKKGLDFNVEINPDILDWRIGDPTRLRQVLVNLIGNAIKFTETGGITISLEKSPTDNRPEVVRITVSDTGIGIPKDRLESIFQSFTQAESSTTRKFGGTGLGLSLSRRFVEQMRGVLTVESEIGKGSRFCCDLPLPVVEQPAAESIDWSCVSGKSILVADASRWRNYLQRLFENAGARVTVASDGAEAEGILEGSLARGQFFDVCIIACRMPVKGGIDLLDQIADKADQIINRLILLMPPNPRPTDAQACVKRGIKRRVEPPFNFEVLHGHIVETLEYTSNSTGNGKKKEEGSLSLLLVDDSADNRSLVKAYLKKVDCSVEEAEDGAQAFQTFQEGMFDLVLMDVQMPILDGLEATRRIRSWEEENGKPRTPVVALTAFAYAEDHERSKNAGCDAHITKPLRKAVLMETIAQFASEPKKKTQETSGAPTSASPMEEVASGDQPSAEPIHVQPDPDIADLVDGYIENRRADLPKLDAAIKNQECDTLSRLGHNMKGSGAAYGLEGVSTIGAGIEKAAKANDLDEVQSLLVELKDYLSRVIVDMPESGDEE